MPWQAKTSTPRVHGQLFENVRHLFDLLCLIPCISLIKDHILMECLFECFENL